MTAESRLFRQGLIAILGTGLFGEGFDELSAAPAFLDRVFPLHGSGSIRVFLRIDQFPGPFLFRILGTYLVVVLYSGLDVLGGSDIIGPVLETSQDIHENRHTKL
jgi:hypothetical protein